jgi:hypothetical protein
MGIENILNFELSNLQNFSLGLIQLFLALICLAKINRSYYFKNNAMKFMTSKNFNSVALYAGILITVFFLGTSYDYRLIFIVPILQLISSNFGSVVWTKTLGVLILTVMYLSRFGIFSILGDILFLFVVSHLILLIYSTNFPRLKIDYIAKSIQKLFIK